MRTKIFLQLEIDQLIQIPQFSALIDKENTDIKWGGLFLRFVKE